MALKNKNLEAGFLHLPASKFTQQLRFLRGFLAYLRCCQVLLKFQVPEFEVLSSSQKIRSSDDRCDVSLYSRRLAQIPLG